MSRIGTKTLLHYVLHNFKINPLSLVNRNFHVNYVSIENDKVTWLTKNGMLTYMYKINWEIEVSEYDNVFSCDNEGRVTYAIMFPRPNYQHISFYMNDKRIMAIHSNKITRAYLLLDPFLKSVWHELANTDISGKIALLIKYQVELKSHMLRLAN